VTFTKVRAMYLSQIHSLHHSVLPLPPFLEQFQQVSFCPFSCIVFLFFSLQSFSLLRTLKTMTIILIMKAISSVMVLPYKT
jgi:hypothetical protein